jgi:hypothetical protein
MDFLPLNEENLRRLGASIHQLVVEPYSKTQKELPHCQSRKAHVVWNNIQ